MIREYNVQSGEITEREITLEETSAMHYENIDLPYEQRVVSLIRERYTIDDEIAINRQKDSKPDEWQEYFDYCEWCKIEANK